MPESRDVQNEHQSAVIQLWGGAVEFRVEVRLTPAGIVAIGCLVTGVLLSTAILVWTATVPARHPFASRIKPR
jgi:hypothetical protein